MKFLKNIFKGKREVVKVDLESMFKQGIFSEEEFLRYTITQKEIALEKAKEDFKKFSTKKTKK